MQTFLPYISFVKSAKALDSKRLNKQITEAMQIYKACFEDGPKPGNPYPYLMWQEYQGTLICYGYTFYQEWQRRFTDGERGGKLHHKSGEEFVARFSLIKNCIPHWLTEEFASNHRSILLGKAKEADEIAFDNWIFNYPDQKLYKKFEKAEKVYKWYKSLGWSEEPAVKVDGKWPYLWPE